MAKRKNYKNWLNKLTLDDKHSLLDNLLDTLVPDEKYAVIVRLEKELKAASYDWMVFNKTGDVRR